MEEGHQALISPNWTDCRHFCKDVEGLWWRQMNRKIAQVFEVCVSLFCRFGLILQVWAWKDKTLSANNNSVIFSADLSGYSFSTTYFQPRTALPVPNVYANHRRCLVLTLFTPTGALLLETPRTKVTACSSTFPCARAAVCALTQCTGTCWA